MHRWWYTYRSKKNEFVNGKDDIPYMKWKIKFMFETTNHNAMIYLNLPSKLAETTNQYWLDNNNSYSWFTHIYPLYDFPSFFVFKGHGFHRLHFTSWHRVHRVAVCASGGWWRPWSPGCGSCLTAFFSPVRNPMICRVQTRQTESRSL